MEGCRDKYKIGGGGKLGQKLRLALGQTEHRLLDNNNYYENDNDYDNIRITKKMTMTMTKTMTMKNWGYTRPEKTRTIDDTKL